MNFALIYVIQYVVAFVWPGNYVFLPLLFVVVVFYNQS